MTKEEIFSFFHDLAIVPVVAIEDADKAVPLAKAMIDGGIPCAEVTFRTAAAEQAIKNMVAAFPEMVVGAGTVINPELAEKAVNAGAKFIVSAGLNPATVKWCNDHNVPVTPGVCTPSEIEQGLSMGLNVLKFFPAEASGGVNMLKNFGGPFKQVKFMTTGGISPANLADYAKASNVLAIGGSWMVKPDLINNCQWDEITRLCAEAVEKVQGLEIAHVGIYADSDDENDRTAAEFAKFGMTINKGKSSTFMDKTIELVPHQGRGAKGHIAYKCYDVDRTIAYLKKKGFTVDESSVQKDAKGTKIVYFNEHINGFAIHLTRG